MEITEEDSKKQYNNSLKQQISKYSIFLFAFWSGDFELRYEFVTPLINSELSIRRLSHSAFA